MVRVLFGPSLCCSRPYSTSLEVSLFWGRTTSCLDLHVLCRVCSVLEAIDIARADEEVQRALVEFDKMLGSTFGEV